MGEWKSKVAAICMTASLIGGSITMPVHAMSVQSTSKIQQEKYRKAAIGLNQPWIQQLPKAAESPFSEDTLVVHYRTPISMSDHKRMGATFTKQFSDLNYAIVKVQDKTKLQKVMSNYRDLHSVISVNQSVIYQSYGMLDPKRGEQYHLTQLQVEKAQNLAPNKKIKVAVIDTGIDMRHPELSGQVLPSYNAVNPMNPGLPDAHGTHVAGIIAAKKDNGIGGYGINPNAMIIPIDVFNRGGGATDYSIAQGILQAIKSNAKVINMSLGGPVTSPLIEDAVKKALAKNIVIVAAAGNSGDDWTNYPAGYEGVISVGNINHAKKLAVSSSYGPSIDVVAPGEEIYSTIYEAEKLSSFRKASGTSMASPVVAGIVSLLLTKYPTLTPAQVEYILEHTSKDLGAKGFDVQYGNGLVDPVSALQFDIKKLPNLNLKPLTKTEILKQAKALELGTNKPIIETGLITKPFEEKWIKFNVVKGEYIQTILEGAKLFDYKMMIHFYSSEDKKFQVQEINEVREGKVEGKLLKAPFTGTVAIGVKDVNGSYDDSKVKLSQYSLFVTKQNELPQDESSLAAPIEIKELPFDTEEFPLTFTGENGDDDFFTFSVKEKQVIKVESSAVPGINSEISVYTADMLPPVESEGMAEGTDALDEVEETIPAIPPIFFANTKGKSEGETLTFVANPETPYMIKVSNKPMNSFYGPFDMYMGNGSETKAEASNVPYSIMVNGKVLPEDEDNYPMMSELPIEEIEEGLTEEIDGQTYNSNKTVSDPWMDDYFSNIEAISKPYMVGQTAEGYLQYMGDEDWFQITPAKTGIYEFNLTASDLPIMEIFQPMTLTNEKGEKYSTFNFIGSNIKYGWSKVEVGQKLYTGLKAQETYYIKVNGNWMNNQISFDPYRFTSKLFITNPQDKYEDNNELEKVKNLPSMTFEGNFAMPNDQDVFYLQSSSTQLYGVRMERGNLSSSLSKYPKEIISPFYGYLSIYEDTNKNRKLDPTENRTVQFIDRGASSGRTFGSFKAEKGKNYIIAIAGYTEGSTPLTLMPYKLSIDALNKKDEDAGNKVVNQKPSKPIAIKKVNSNLWEATGYLNPGIGYGDEDWYTFTLDRNRSGVIKLESSIEVDGKIELYQNGKLISTADFYPEGDAEVLSVNLKKGTYQIKIKDYFGNSTLTSYRLRAHLK
jgi:cell wall-associated protease